MGEHEAKAVDRSADPVWQAFERERPADAPELTDDEHRKTARGLAQMRRGQFVDIDAELLKLVHEALATGRPIFKEPTR